MAVVEIYHRRWQIETLFKQLKQNFELKYFFGDNANAIESQVWAVLIANMLVSKVKIGGSIFKFAQKTPEKYL